MNQDPNKITIGIPNKPLTTSAVNRSARRMQPSRLAIGVHSMPKTSAGNLRLWFVLGGIILALFAVIIFLVLN